MGRHVQWLAVRGVPIDDMLAALRIEREPDPSGGRTRSSCSLLELASGWNLVLLDGSDANFGRLDWHAKRLAARGGDAVHFFCNDTSMITEIGGMTNGSAWTLGYDGENGVDPDEVRIDGVPPSFVGEIIAARRRDQESDPDPEPADHLYDIAPSIGKVSTGFHHDDGEDVEGTKYVLRVIPDGIVFQRKLSAAGLADALEPSLEAVLEALSDLDPVDRRFVRLEVKSRLRGPSSLFASYEHGSLRLEARSHEGRHVGVSRETAKVALGDLIEAFRTFYSDAERDSRIRWQRV